MYLHGRRLGNYGVEGLWDELRHIVLCFEAETRRLWILPNPSDPRERFLDVCEELNRIITSQRHTLKIRTVDLINIGGDGGKRYWDVGMHWHMVHCTEATTNALTAHLCVNGTCAAQ